MNKMSIFLKIFDGEKKNNDRIMHDRKFFSRFFFFFSFEPHARFRDAHQIALGLGTWRFFFILFYLPTLS